MLWKKISIIVRRKYFRRTIARKHTKCIFLIHENVVFMLTKISAEQTHHRYTRKIPARNEKVEKKTHKNKTFITKTNEPIRQFNTFVRIREWMLSHSHGTKKDKNKTHNLKETKIKCICALRLRHERIYVRVSCAPIAKAKINRLLFNRLFLCIRLWSLARNIYRRLVCER